MTLSYHPALDCGYKSLLLEAIVVLFVLNGEMADLCSHLSVSWYVGMFVELMQRCLWLSHYYTWEHVPSFNL